MKRRKSNLATNQKCQGYQPKMSIIPSFFRHARLDRESLPIVMPGPDRASLLSPSSPPAGGSSVWCPRAPFRAGALHSVLPTAWLVRRANGQSAGPFHSYAVDGYTHRAPHRPPACRHPYRFNHTQFQPRYSRLPNRHARPRPGISHPISSAVCTENRPWSAF